jgi:hypothetical protein
VDRDHQEDGDAAQRIDIGKARSLLSFPRHGGRG